jgi:ELWxxDGT repeat protein
LYFIAKDEEHGTELWRTDGTAAGTKLVMDIHPGKIGSFPSNLISDGKRLYFTAYTPESGVELWTTQGTASDTYQLYDLIEGPRGSLPNHLFLVGDQKELYFVAESLEDGPQLWRSNFANITDTDHVLQDHDFGLYPNPTSDYLSIVNPNLKLSQIYIFNADGKLIQTCKAGSERIYIGDQPAGIYLLVAQTANGLISRRFVKVN